jgi:exopolysaccharide production protein ExoQ
MPPGLAAVVFAAGILMLFRLDRPKTETAGVSLTLWIPTTWILIAGSRMVSEWFQAGSQMKSPDEYLDGSPVDRMVLTVLLAAGLTALFWRWRRAAAVMKANAPVVLFFLYCAVSVLWSDYPDIAFKRWMKAVGDFVMVLVVLTEPDPRTAVKRLLARAAFVLIPLSVLFIKYYPELGRGYDRWTWSPYYAGVATGKNGLGYICLVLGLGCLWRWLGAFRPEDGKPAAGPLIAHGVVLAMILWLFWKADSATSLACFLLGGSLLAIANMRTSARTGPVATVFIGLLVLLAASGLFLSSGTGLVEALGRDTTLTGRTDLWQQLLRIPVDPLFGTGFESFWLGERVEAFWRTYWWHPNQAHNGYLEIFLNLGWMGLALLAVVVAGAGRNIRRAFHCDPETARLCLAYLVVALLYNLTEAAFKSFHLMWFAFLLAAVAHPTARRVGGAINPLRVAGPEEMST